MLCSLIKFDSFNLLKYNGQNLRYRVLKSVLDIIKYANFQFYKAYSDGVVWKTDN